MGYKLAGYTVVGCCEIDPAMFKMYVKNHHPKNAYNMDIREMARLPEFPDDLKDLDILDGSPPCSVFSLAGDREDGWGIEKKFREGQKEQRLDDLFLHFIDLAERLQPKVIVAENVKGIIIGNAKGWMNQILRKLDAAGYKAQVFLLNASRMGVPQARERVFFVCRRKDLPFPDIRLEFNEEPIPFGKVREPEGLEVTAPVAKILLLYRQPGDRKLSDISKRLRRKNSGYTQPIFWDNEPIGTLTAGGPCFRMFDGKALTNNDIIRCQTFPEDYNFDGNNVQYVCGMSVPPYMMQRIASEIRRQWFREAE